LRRSSGGSAVGGAPTVTWTTVLLLRMLRMLLGVVGEGDAERLVEEVHEVDIELVDAGEAMLLQDEADDVDGAQDGILLLMVSLRDWRRGILRGFRANEANGIILGRSNVRNVLKSGMLRLTDHVCISV
jgi:hypothetical protein